MTEENSGNAQDLAILRERAKAFSIPNYQTKGYPRLYKEVMEATDKQMEESKAQGEAVKREAVKNLKTQTVADKQELGGEKYYFTNPKNGKIGEYILTDKKNMTPWNAKGTAFRLTRWV